MKSCTVFDMLIKISTLAADIKKKSVTTDFLTFPSSVLDPSAHDLWLMSVQLPAEKRKLEGGNQHRNKKGMLKKLSEGTKLKKKDEQPQTTT